MLGVEEDYFVGIYGDGSQTDPTNWWAALGGFGIWVPAWNKTGENNPDRQETSYHGLALGQTGTSTRQELTAWLQVLAIPVRSHYATDSASMMGKALKLIEAAKDYEDVKAQGKPYRKKNPFGKTCGLQTDGDLWEQAWIAVLKR